MLTDILIETSRWVSIPEERRQEWRLAIRELLDEHLFRVEQSPLLLRVIWDDTLVQLRFETAPGDVVADIQIPRAERLDRQLREYIDTCKGLSSLEDRRASLQEISSIDQSKRDAHDLAARDLSRDLAPVGPTHDTARRLFTLLVVLLVDTTQIGALRRPHGSDVIQRYSS